jgi:predicted dehydrogenase
MTNVAIIGTGNIARWHIEGYLKFPDRVKITHLVDIYPEKCEKVKTDFGLDAQVQVHSAHKEILEAEDVDLISICTPPYCHAEIAIDFLNAGKHVIGEKPMAASLEECDAIIAAVAKSGKHYVPVAQNRFTDPIKILKAAVDSGLIGRVVHAQIDSFWWRGHSYYDLWWRGTWEKEGGGCTLNHAVHHIDMLGWMLGRPESVTAVISNAAHDNSEVEDISVAIMQYPKGSLAQVTSSVIHHGEEQQVIFQGEKARISAPWKVVASDSKPNGFPVKNAELENQLDTLVKSQKDLKYIGHPGLIDDVLTAIETGSQPMIRPEDGRLTIELITAIFKAGTEHVTVALPLQKDDPFYTVKGILEHVPHFYEKTSAAQNLDGEITVEKI